MSELLVERADGVVRLTLNRPDKMSAITRSMWGGFAEVFREVATNRDDSVLVITGPHDGFCGGSNLMNAEMPRSDGGRQEYMRGVGCASHALHDITKPTLAAVNGVAAGAVDCRHR